MLPAWRYDIACNQLHNSGRSPSRISTLYRLRGAGPANPSTDSILVWLYLRWQPAKGDRTVNQDRGSESGRYAMEPSMRILVPRVILEEELAALPSAKKD
jgi:hypothetical protein